MMHDPSHIVMERIFGRWRPPMTKPPPPRTPRQRRPVRWAATSRDRAMTGRSAFQIGEHSRPLGPYSERLAVDDAARAVAHRRLAQAVAQPPQYEDLLVWGSTTHGAQAQLGLCFHGPAPLVAPCGVGLCTLPWTYGLSKW